MKLSVLIPVYNGCKTIRATIESVLAQTRPADEILVVNDGSTDDTLAILSSFAPRITVFSRPNSGVAASRNFLYSEATGDVVAFIDADDLWRENYLAQVERQFRRVPSAIALYAGHFDFHGYGSPTWKQAPDSQLEIMEAREFFIRYNRATGNFGSMSYCSFRRQLGSDGPLFWVDGVEDSWLSCCFALSGFNVIYLPTPLVAYRVIDESISANHVKSFGRWIQVFELMERRFAKTSMLADFRLAYAAKRRSYAKLLMGAGRSSEARQQILQSFAESWNPLSLARSAFVLARTFLSSDWPTGRAIAPPQ